MRSAALPTTVQEILTVLRVDYRDAVDLSARQEILADLAEDAVTARFHHGRADAYARALGLILSFRGEEEELEVSLAKRRARRGIRETDLAPMRCHGQRYRPFASGEVRGRSQGV